MFFQLRQHQPQAIPADERADQIDSIRRGYLPFKGMTDSWFTPGVDKQITGRQRDVRPDEKYNVAGGRGRPFDNGKQSLRRFFNQAAAFFQLLQKLITNRQLSFESILGRQSA